MSPDEVHQLGLEQGKEISARHGCPAAARQGKKTGNRRRAHARPWPRTRNTSTPDTDAGRQQILDYCNGLIAALQGHLPKYFHIRPQGAGGDPAGAGLHGGRGRPAATTRFRPSMARGRAPSTSICATHQRMGALGRCRRSPITSPRPGHHFSARAGAGDAVAPVDPQGRGGGFFRQHRRGGHCTPSSCAMRWGCMTPIRSGRLGMLQAALFPRGTLRGRYRIAREGLESGNGRSSTWSPPPETNPAAMTTEVERYCTLARAGVQLQGSDTPAGSSLRARRAATAVSARSSTWRDFPRRGAHGCADAAGGARARDRRVAEESRCVRGAGCARGRRPGDQPVWRRCSPTHAQGGELSAAGRGRLPHQGLQVSLR